MQHLEAMAAVKVKEEALLAAEREKARLKTEAKLLQMKEESDRRVQQERVEFESKIAIASATATVEAQVVGERQNEDVHTRSRAQQGDIDTRKVKEALAQMGEGISSILNNPEQLTRLVAAIAALVCCGFMAREGAKLARKRLEAILGKPSLVRATLLLSFLSLSP